MSWINNQVKLGEPLMIHRQPQRVNLTPFLYGSRRLGVVPGIGGGSGGPQISPLAIGGFVIGGGLVVGGIFVKGAGGIVMSVVGGIAAGFSLITTLLGMMGPSTPSTRSSFPTIPSKPSPPAKASRTQQIEQFAQALAPTALPILQNLLKPGSVPAAPSPAPAPPTAPAPSSGIPGLVTSL